MSAAIVALNEALQLIQGAMSNPEATERAFDLARATMLVIQGRDVLVQTEKDLRESTVSTTEAHRQLHHLQIYAADTRRVLQQLHLRESIALQSHTERVAVLDGLRSRDPAARTALESSFVVSTDAPRPVAAGA